MTLRRRIATIAAGAIAAPLVMVALPTAPAFAHGYVSSPPSRQAQCAKGTVPCGSIKYEPQSVEGPKGLRSCHGGNAGFAELNNDSKGWKVTNVGQSVTFNWVFTARHRTANYEYYVGNKRVGFVDGKNQAPGATVSHTVNLGGVTGQQKVLAIWNIGDTSNAFYACIDVNVG
ncbi:lytic polysaccharide monooxygenase auxiliary activity family 9 protein [Saccharothrix obliqua]|uniref:lytic polysaccharide monooxygenase auxiliary activity family 9 protein n=1 Tax=Saccharothrix obliqua TaxID=2861747 RepID=UPI001C5FD8ED|nr:lytic polysaccharide monooxygenase auxiliary activity family 9 protein [Saccharothrix obliqua]MBW4721211.1 lytic polysaccharide monooxygenase [Saccharothrix obliqua]